MKLQFCRLIFGLLLGAIPTQMVLAKEFPVTARLFAGALDTDPKDLNTEMTAQGLKKFGTVGMLGFEATYAVAKFLDAGFRYTKRTDTKEENPDDPATEYSGELNQDSVAVVVRIPFVKTSIFHADVFGAAGGTNTKFKIKTASQDGELARTGSDGWFGSPITTFGASFAVGYKRFYLVFEGGVESNKVKKFDKTGTVNDVDSIDLSGSYASIGLMFDTTASKK